MHQLLPVDCNVSRRHVTGESDALATPRVHERGDKVVVNGAKESLLSILRRHLCRCGKHTGDKLALKFLSLNRITASYDVLVWMFINLKLNSEAQLYNTILKQYLMKMHKKSEENQNHQSEKYKMSKKKTLQKFIQSAELLMSPQLNQETIERSIGALYLKGKSKQNALVKVRNFLKKNKLENNLQFVSSNCSLLLKNQLSNKQGSKELKQEQNSLKLSSDNSEGRISQQCPLQKAGEEIEMLEDYQSVSQWLSPWKDSYDLFEVILHSENSEFNP